MKFLTAIAAVSLIPAVVGLWFNIDLTSLSMVAPIGLMFVDK